VADGGVESLRWRTSCQCVVGVMRSLEVTVAVIPLSLWRRSGVGVSAEVCGCDVSSVDTDELVDTRSGSEDPFWFAKSSTQLGSRRTASGIGSTPSGRGYCSRRHWRSLTDHGTKDPSILAPC
jgi:hypothetical protein